jgi:hypothetical protein
MEFLIILAIILAIYSGISFICMVLAFWNNRMLVKGDDQKLPWYVALIPVFGWIPIIIHFVGSLIMRADSHESKFTKWFLNE